MSSIISYKVVLLGDSGVGKSSIAQRYIKNEYSEFQESTIGASFLTKTIERDDNSRCRFEIWDTAGQERYHSLAPMYYRGARGCVVVYDITSTHSFEKAQSWVNELQQSGSPDMIISLVGNKQIEDIVEMLARMMRKNTLEIKIYSIPKLVPKQAKE